MRTKTAVNLLLLVALGSLLSCVQEKKPEPVSPASNNLGGGSTSGGTTGGGTQLVATSVKVKNYNQYNMTLEKLTGVNRSTHNTLFNALKGSLPADNEISGMTPFNLIAISRLADAYCTSFVERKITQGQFPNNSADAINLFMSTFLDAAPADQPDYYRALTDQLENIYDNNAGDGSDLFPSPDTGSAHKNYSIAACVVILASPYVTLLE